MKKNINTRWTFVLIIIVAHVHTLRSQSVGKQTKAEATFRNMRNTEFTKLSGVQEGAKLSYDEEKAKAEGSGGFSIIKNAIGQLGGSLGTTGNLMELFNQNVTPAFTASLTLHVLLRGTVYYFDGTLGENMKKLKNDKLLLYDIVPVDSVGHILQYTYTEDFRSRILSGKYVYDSILPLYTCKRFFWASLGYSYNNINYQFYNKSLAFSDQLFEEHYTSGIPKGSINFYQAWNKRDISWRHWRPEFFFITAGIKYGSENNVPTLKKSNLTDVISTEVDSSGNIRQTVKTTSAYDGKLVTYNAFVPSAEIVFSPVRAWALDLFSEYSFLDKSTQNRTGIDSYLSLAAGVYYYGGEETSKVNIGIFYKWTRNSNKALKEEIGIKLTLPITPIF